MKKVIPVLILFTVSYCKAQSLAPGAIASDGNYFSSPLGSISWTIGEPVSDTYTGTNILTKGFQQPKILTLNSVPDNNSGENVFAYPNPVTDNLTLDFSAMETGDYSIDVFDVTGNLLKRSTIKVNADLHREKINLSDYADGLYFLKIMNTSNSKTKTISIIRQK